MLGVRPVFKPRASFLLLLFVVANVSSCFTYAQKEAGASGPSLSDTIAFMNRAVQPEDSYVTTANHCELNVLRNRLYTFGLPTDVYEKNTDRYGGKHYGFHWLMVNEAYQLMQFQLGEIDSVSIKTQAVPSKAFIEQKDVDEHPDLLKTPDLFMVSFSTRDLVKSVAVGQIKRSDDGTARSDFTDHKNGNFIIFESKDRAERFVTAFVHAVGLCGGGQSDFPPTPTRP